DNDGDDLTHPNLSTYKADDEEKEKKADDEEVSSDQRVSTPLDYQLTNEKENKEGDDKDKEGEHVQDEEDDLYSNVKINMERSDDKMTDAQANQDTKDSHVTNSCASSSATLKFFCFIRLYTQVYSVILPHHLTSQAMLESEAYKTYYAYASIEKTLKPKYVRKKDDSDTSPKKKSAQATKAEQLMLATKISKTQFHSSHVNGSGDGVDTHSKVPDEQQQK
nr:hypothetical protein [Tanacetum cinerariifolium]